MKYSEKVKVLLIEDDDVDAECFKRNFEKMGLKNPIVWADNSHEGLDLILGQNGKEAIEPPYIIITDLNMPRMNGHEFLEKIRSIPETKRCITFVLSTSSDASDIEAAYDKNVAGYLIKSSKNSEFQQLADFINKYLNSIEMPKVDNTKAYV